MFGKFKSWFSKGDEDYNAPLPKNEAITFKLMVDSLPLGILICSGGIWKFKYTKEFKEHKNEYTRIVGFPDLDKEYESDTLWPFFRIRIPGLKQPAIREIIKEDKIDQENEAALLKRFGHKSISNPYELEVV